MQAEALGFPRGLTIFLGYRVASRISRGTYYGSVRPNIDFPILADLDLEKKINLDDLISRTYRFDEINEGFALMLAGEVARGVIVFD